MVKIRKIETAEAPILSSMSDKVNWNIAPAECGLLTSADNMCGYFLEVDGEIAGSAGVVTYEPQSLVFINMVIVKEEFRRRGYATMMLEHILESTKDYRTKRLHATPDGSKVYAPLGFESRRTISFFASDTPDLHAPENIGVHQMRQEELADVIKRDAECYGHSRQNLLEFNFREYGNLAFVSDDGKAHILGRRWKKYRQMAALTSEDLPTAMALAAAASNLDKSQAQSIICYDQQKEFMEFLKSGGFVKVREMVDMVLGEDPEVPPMPYRTIYGGDMG
jgi:GNAT superfamily N-acetyltransferase